MPASVPPQPVPEKRLLEKGLLEKGLPEARQRAGAAVVALRGERVGPPVAVRRWPWAVGAAVAGAAAGVGVAIVLSRLRTRDAPDALEPEELKAVVDRADGQAGSAEGDPA